MNNKAVPLFSPYTNKTIEQVAALFKTSVERGLSANQVIDQRKMYGSNYVAMDYERSLWRIYLTQFQSPFIALLCVVTGISMITENVLSGIIVLIVLMMNSMLGCYLEYSAQQTMQALKRYINRRTTVIRDDAKTVVDSKDLVPGDLIELGVGDVVPADVRFVMVKDDFAVDESTVTGESQAVSKLIDVSMVAIEQEHEAKNIGFSGTIVIAGQARALVIATGRYSTIGVIASCFEQIDKLGSFNSIIARFSKLLLYVVCTSLIIIFLVHILVKQGSVDFIQLLMFTSALIAGIVPSTLPLITTFALSYGAVRLKRVNTIVKRLSAIIDLGNINVLCTDKTGTLTENVLKVVDIHGADERLLLLSAALAGKIALKKQADLFGFESALYTRLTDAERADMKSYVLIDEIPFSYQMVLGTVLVEKGKNRELIIRGGVEAVLSRCTGLSEAQQQAVHQWEYQEGQRARRILAVAKKSDVQGEVIAEIEQHTQGYIFLGLISFSDPIKTTAQEAIVKAQQLGIDLKVLSGDSKVVCGVVAHTLGLIENPEQVITGAEFEQSTLHEKREMVRRYRVFARVSPVHKYEIVSLLQEHKTVGYVGDGINDLLALKAAHVGIAVQEAVDSVREVSDIILLRKSLRSIIDAIEEGRYAFVNTMKYIKVMLSSNLGNFYSLAIAGLFLDYLPMLPAQILLVDLLSNIPLLTFATDRVSKKDIRHPNVSLMHIIILATLLGLITTVFDFIYLTRFVQAPHAMVQTGWFLWSVLSELIIIFSVRTEHPFFKGTSPGLLLICSVVCVAGFAMALPYFCIGGVCPGQILFGFVPVPLQFLSGIGTLLVANFIAIEVVKLLYFHIWNGYNGRQQKK